MSKEVKIFKDAISHNWWFYGFSVVAIALIIASWFVPPMAVIDASVLAAVGEIFAFAALGAVIKAIDKGTPASLSHNNTTITVNKEHRHDEDRRFHHNDNLIVEQDEDYPDSEI